MVGYTLKISQQMLQDFYSVPDHIGLCIKGFKLYDKVVSSVK